jgi:hypothetical protein
MAMFLQVGILARSLAENRFPLKTNFFSIPAPHSVSDASAQVQEEELGNTVLLAI